MEDNLLAESNVCGQTLLRLVARGSAVVSEVLKLADAVPDVFRGRGEAFARYELVIFDFSYLKMQERFEDHIGADEDLLSRDLELQTRYAKLADRYFLLFRAVVRYHRKLMNFWRDLETGFYIQHSVEEILMDRDGAQLMCEALYQYGVMLALLELRIPLATRERLVVFALRVRGESALADLDAVLTLAGSDDFARLRIDPRIARMIASKLELDDVYAMRRAFPRPDDRTTALGQQAAMLFVVLRFCPEVLREGRASMRAIVDRFFCDNWVVPIYMGTWIDLREAWQGFPAAAAALRDSQEKPKDLNVREVQAAIDQYLVKGVLTDKFVLEQLQRLMRVVRRSNVMIRWLLLHRARDPGLIDAESVVELVLSAAQLEFVLKTKLKALSASKHDSWISCREQAAKRMGELREYFSGTVALTRVKRDDTLVAWFSRIASEIEALDYANPTLAGRRIQKLVLALREVEKIDEIDTSLHVKQFLADSRDLLLQMVRVVALDEALLANLDLVTDMSFAWELIGDYMDLLHARIRKDPGSIKLLRATFLKLASILDVPLTRISQADSRDAPLVAAYYSGELVNFVQRVLSVIPRTMFDMLVQVTDLLAQELPAIPTKVEAARLRDIYEPEKRFRVAELSHRISVFTEGVLAMQKTLLGVVEVDPRQLLEDGIRTELVARVCRTLERDLVPAADADVSACLERAAAKMQGLRRSLEFVQDYVAMNGLRMWHDVTERIFQAYISYEVDQRPPSVGDGQVPVHVDGHGRTFLGRLVLLLRELSRPGVTIYVPKQASWHSRELAHEVLGKRLLRGLQKAIGVPGLSGLDRVLRARLARELSSFWADLSAHATGEVASARSMLVQGIARPAQFAAAIKACGGTSRASMVVSLLVNLGRTQLLRIRLQHELRFTARIESELVQAAAACAEEQAFIAGDAGDLSDHLATLLERCGLADPLESAPQGADNSGADVPTQLVLAVVDALERLQFDETYGTLVPSASHPSSFDGFPLVTGVVTVLGQLPSACTEDFLQGLGAFTRGCIAEAFHARSGSKILSPAAVAAMQFVDAFANLASVDAAVISAAFPRQCRAHLHLLYASS